jgi:hypothetical protein
VFLSVGKRAKGGFVEGIISRPFPAAH